MAEKLIQKQQLQSFRYALKNQGHEKETVERKEQIIRSQSTLLGKVTEGNILQ